MFLRVFLLLKCLNEKFLDFSAAFHIEGQMKVGALYAKLINLAAFLQHKNIPLHLHGNVRKNKDRKITEKEEKQQGLQMKRVY